MQYTCCAPKSVLPGLKMRATAQISVSPQLLSSTTTVAALRSSRSRPPLKIIQHKQQAEWKVTFPLYAFISFQDIQLSGLLCLITLCESGNVIRNNLSWFWAQTVCDLPFYKLLPVCYFQCCLRVSLLVSYPCSSCLGSLPSSNCLPRPDLWHLVLVILSFLLI